MNGKKIFSLIKKMGGMRVLTQLAMSRILFFSISITCFLGFNRKSLEIARLAINNRRLQKLRKWNKKFIANYLAHNSSNRERKHSSKVWFLWLQGVDQAPYLVKKCYESLKNNLRDRDIVVLTEANYRNYVSFPDYIQRKIDAGVITKTHFSDLLRLELLERYGGTWIDATVYCSGADYPDYMFDSDLFIYQCLMPGQNGSCIPFSSWFISSTTNHPIISLTKALLYNYWKKRNSMIDYFLIHYFLQLSIETYPDEWKKVVPFCNSLPHMLLLRLFDTYDKRTWDAIKQQTCFHKLTYKFDAKSESLCGTYYEQILKNNEVK